MASDDPVDTHAFIFTESDVYMIGGWLAATWEDDGIPESDSSRTDDIESAITAVLSEVRN